MSETLDWNKNIIKEFRENEGKVGGMFEGGSLLLLTTTGAKSGEPRTSPLVYAMEDGNYLIAASYAGSDKNPAWYHNIVANPKVTLEVGTEKFDATATVVLEDRAERDRLYAKMVSTMPGFAEYEKKTDRVIPVVTISR
ncbi:nitroreductase family deazaflavin-dependent oxidoreductase [Amycolatopsis umgeniensis]|uniref:Deazaflavin-dependent oxidoreductase (Nitroreductase family) n=1 Tax=Amycolatopsis umgeniensis TaxID=336628 RepID=A0A841B3X2_9PSEU|nr:nitroreductase family deazaflavin-dependent oxidoreductase [Amycolatopsis umgeniensis]MBB5853088.1 deazaflavin-dependent oxidoreductase (nitroreductase family) [Amycolatopsis umgeniensis]